MNANQKIEHGPRPSNVNLGFCFAPLVFAGLHNHSPILTMAKLFSLFPHRVRLLRVCCRFPTCFISSMSMFRLTCTIAVSFARCLFTSSAGETHPTSSLFPRHFSYQLVLIGSFIISIQYFSAWCSRHFLARASIR